MSEGAAARRAILEGELHKAVRAASRKLTVHEMGIIRLTKRPAESTL